MHVINKSLQYPDQRPPVMLPACDFVATLPYIPNDSLALNFGGSCSLSTFCTDPVRRFADTALPPVSQMWQMDLK